jgi:hypothetical protein
MKEETKFRCYFTNEYSKVGQILDSIQYNSLPIHVKRDYKPYKEE